MRVHPHEDEGRLDRALGIEAEGPILVGLPRVEAVDERGQVRKQPVEPGVSISSCQSRMKKIIRFAPSSGSVSAMA
jgi:hypothetical protein